jgi:hypothetical protein
LDNSSQAVISSLLLLTPAPCALFASFVGLLAHLCSPNLYSLLIPTKLENTDNGIQPLSDPVWQTISQCKESEGKGQIYTRLMKQTSEVSLPA